MKKKSNSNIIPLLFETYLTLVKNSVGAKTFRNSYAKVDGKKKDILENGGLSCAFFVSSILVICGLVKEIHATVGGTAKDLEKFGWVKMPFDSAQGKKKPEIGSVIVWEAVDFGRGDPRFAKSSRGKHKHIGFYIGKNKAISNHHKKGFPVGHHWTFGEKNGKEVRMVEAIYWNERLK